MWREGGHETVARWHRGEQTVQFLIDRGRLESFEASDLAALADALTGRASLRLEATARAALKNGDVDGAYAAAYDAYRMAAEALLGRQGLRATALTWRSRMPCRPSSPPTFRLSPSRRSSGCAGRGTPR